MSEAEKIDKVPLKLRFKAWWHGYDINDIKARLNGAQDTDATPEEEPEADTTDEAPAPEAPEADKLSILPWDHNRLKVAQLVWGDGYCGPGGPDHVASMSKLLALSSEMSAVVIGAGLGGPSRVLAEQFGVWISGFEENEEMVKKANDLSKVADLEDKAVTIQYDPTSDAPFDRRYDRAFSKEAFYMIKDKPTLLGHLFEQLKDDALFLMTDYVLSDVSALENPDVQKWLVQEATPPVPVTSEVLAGMLEKAGFGLRVNEDISKDYIELITNSWSNADKVAAQLAEKKEDSADLINVLMKEAEFWSLKAQLLKEGHIKVWRFVAHKKAEVK